jgi:hypothetical protein
MQKETTGMTDEDATEDTPIEDEEDEEDQE